MNTLLKSLALCFAIGALPGTASASVYVSIRIAPPPLPIYVQPAPPADDFLWIPGYWAYDDEYEDYYWVPGTWVRAPQTGYLWTPGYWAWGDGLYYWRVGYWGPYVGYYGGVDYGYGYYGSGYYGGRWDHDHFYYNTTVNTFSVTNIHNTYNEPVAERHESAARRPSYNGGQGGTVARPTERDRDGERERFARPTAEQVQHEQGARGQRDLHTSVNKGRPALAATPRPGAFSERNAAPAAQPSPQPQPAPQSRRERREQSQQPPRREQPQQPRREQEQRPPRREQPQQPGREQRPTPRREQAPPPEDTDRQDAPQDSKPEPRRRRGGDKRNDAPADGKK